MNALAYDAGRVMALCGWPLACTPWWLTDAERVCFSDGWGDVAQGRVAPRLEREVVGDGA